MEWNDYNDYIIMTHILSVCLNNFLVSHLYVMQLDKLNIIHYHILNNEIHLGIHLNHK